MMMSMSGGWFFVVASEAITVGDNTITLPGIGAYLATAIDQRNLGAVGWVILVMALVILASGLLPCNGYVIVFTTMKYFLFIAIVVGLGIDFAQNSGSLNPQTSPAQK